jgi:aerobic carbon-monoxide dehydrogenase small subunit
MLMSATALLAEVLDPTEEQIRHYLAGNLCRCTGYSPIVHAVLAAAAARKAQVGVSGKATV